MFRHVLASCFPLLTLAVLFVTTRVGAQAPSSFELEWIAPDGCPSAAEVRTSVAQLLRKTPEHSADSLRVHARVDQDSSGIWRCVVETRVGATIGRRTIEVESCAAAAESTALIVALILDPKAGTAEKSPTPSGPTAPAELKSDPRAPSKPQRNGVGFAVGPVFGFDVGTMPEPTYGLGAMAGTLLGSSSFEIGFVVWKAQRGSVPGLTPEAGGSVGLIAGVFGLCPALAFDRIDVGGCLAAELGRFNAEGYGVDDSVAAGSRWMAVGAGPLARVRLAKALSLSLRTDLLFALDRPSFVVDIFGSSEEFHRPSPLVGRVLLSLDLRFGS